MLISILLILVVAAGGFALTYLIERDELFLWRWAAGAVIGSAVYGTLSFVIGCFAGMTFASPAALVLTLSPLLLFREKTRMKALRADWRRAKDKMQGRTRGHSIGFLYYAFFFLLFCLFFGQAMYQTSAGIFTGGAHNLGDLPFHLGAIFSFTEANNLPPHNPSWAGAKFSYPFIADMVTAGFIKLGADIRGALVVQDIAWAFSLLVLLERFVFRLTADRLAGKIATWLLLFSGGLGFIWFFSEYWEQGKGILQYIWDIPKDYTIGPTERGLRWGNSMTTLFMTQRSLLLGMPLTIVVLQKLWEWFESDKAEKKDSVKGEKLKSGKAEKGKGEKVSPARNGFSAFALSHYPAFVVGMLAGMLPLVHLHSLAVLFVVTAFLLVLNTENWRTWITFGIGVCLVAVPELLWSLTGSPNRATEFFEWYFGWDKGDVNFVWFWIKNTGLVIPLIAAGAYLYFRDRENAGDKKRYPLLLFYTPFLFLFIVSNVAKLAPWQWDNIKVLIYWFLGSLSFIALALSWMWRQRRPWQIAAVVCFAVLIFSGVIDVWRTVSGQIRTNVFDPNAVRIAEMIRLRTPPKALFLTAPTYNSAIALTGRQSLMLYPGHLSSHGIDYAAREADVEKMYQGGAAADQLLEKYGIDYVLASQEESGSTQINQSYFSKYPVIAEAGSVKVYKIR